MDPNAALAEIRKQLKALLTIQPDVDVTEAAMSLAEHVQGLDEWLTKGGFLPSAWDRSRTVIWELTDGQRDSLAADAGVALRLRVAVDGGDFKWDAGAGWMPGIAPTKTVQQG